jgi:hypothetical protein
MREAIIKKEKTMYNYHGIYNFSNKEIETLCSLVKRWSMGDIYMPVDARTLTKQVKEWAINWNLLEVRNRRIHITTGYIFNLQSLPLEVIWRLVQPMLREDGTAGYSIVNNPLWMKHFGIAPQNNRHVTDGELKEKEDILCLLALHQYIYLQMAGNVWSITRREEENAA